MAGVALGDIDLRFEWQAWYLWDWGGSQIHTQHLCHTPFSHTSLSHTHTTLSHTMFHTQLCHAPSFTHNFVNITLSHTIFCRTQLCHTPSFTRNFPRNFVTHHLSHTSCSSHTTFSLIEHPPLPLSALPLPIPRKILEEVDLWGFPVL